MSQWITNLESPIGLANQQIQAATDRSQHTIYVVVYEEVIDGEVDPQWSSETEEALARIQAELEGFVATHSRV